MTFDMVHKNPRTFTAEWHKWLRNIFSLIQDIPVNNTMWILQAFETNNRRYFIWRSRMSLDQFKFRQDLGFHSKWLNSNRRNSTKHSRFVLVSDFWGNQSICNILKKWITAKLKQLFNKISENWTWILYLQTMTEQSSLI